MVNITLFASFALVASASAQPLLKHNGQRMHRVKRQGQAQVIGAAVVPIAPAAQVASPPLAAGIGAIAVGGPVVVPIAAANPPQAAGVGAQALGPVSVVNPTASVDPAALGVVPSATAPGIGTQALGPVSVLQSSSTDIPTATLSSFSATPTATEIFQNLGVESEDEEEEPTKTGDCTEQPEATGEVSSNARNNFDNGEDGEEQQVEDEQLEQNEEECDGSKSQDDEEEASIDEDDEPVRTRTVTVFVDPTDIATVPVSNRVAVQTPAARLRRRQQQRVADW